MRVAIVHDDLVQWGGAERVLSAISDMYPDANIFTSLFDNENKEIMRNFGKRKITKSFLQKIPGWKNLYKSLLPFYGLAFEQFDFSGYDLVISHTTRFAKSIVTRPETKHICYCHTPPRFLWHFSGERSYGFAELLMTNLRVYDQISAKRVDFFLAGSENAKRRIKNAYRADSDVVYPFVDLERFKNIETFDGGYFVVIGRKNKYKKFDLAVNTCKKSGFPLKIISGGFSDEMVIRILAGCRALIIPGIEDFGLTSLEAQALGKPVVAFKDGGALETIIPDKTGVFFDEQTEESLQNALLRLFSLKIDPDDCKENAKKFGKERFIQNFKQKISDLL